MRPEEIKLGDWARFFFGETPPSFFIEVVIRALVVFLLLIISMRLLGKRMAAQITRLEIVALFSLAAAIGVPLQAPDRGLLPAAVIAIVVVMVGRAVDLLAFNNPRFEKAIKDRLTVVVKDGVFDLKKIKATSMTTERITANLRSQGIRHLGEVKRLYFQSNGSFSVVKEQEPRPGLCLLPPQDKDFIGEQEKSDEKVCSVCGHQEKCNPAGACANCGNKEWVGAVA